jgi:gluconate 2-dehydrogenase gamma chain
MTDLQHRRTFLRAAAAAGAAWATADLADVEAALAWAGGRQEPARATFSALSDGQARTIEALAARIIPSVDGRPGAREAGAVHFIDRALATFNAAQKKTYEAGAIDLDRRAARKARTASFASLTPSDQDDIIREIEKTPFFQTARFDTIVGTFGLPAIGANRDHAGWRLLGLDHSPQFQPPFGHYDQEINRRR